MTFEIDGPLGAADRPGAEWTVPEGYTLTNLAACRGCGATIGWCLTPRGAKAPIDPDGRSHFATCPEAKRFRAR